MIKFKYFIHAKLIAKNSSKICDGFCLMQDIENLLY